MTKLLEGPFEVFRNAPIREALIDVRTTLPEKRTTADLQTLGKRIRNEYPREQVRRVLQSSFKVDDKSEPTQKLLSDTVEGYQYWNSEKNQAVQFRRNGFTFSRLKPYVNWEHLRDQARGLWAQFAWSIEPMEASRIAVRFINVIEIPGLYIDLDKYLSAAPEVPDNLPQSFKEYFSRYTIQFPEQNAQAIVQLAFPHGASENLTKVLLDIDVFREQTFARPFDVMWDSIEELSFVKDTIFFSYITETAKELFR